ncbi:MAG: hypothetical protein QOI61_906, partial [Actinomycetota bacterium]
MRLTAAVALLLLLVGCGDGQPLNVEGSTTTTSAVEASPSTTAPTTTVPPPSVAQPQCVSDLSNDGYDYTADPDKVGAQQEALRGDQEALLAYGAEHPDEYTAVAFNNRPTVILVGYFTGHLDEHRAALRRRLSHPDKFELRQSLQSERDARAMSDAIRDD